MKDEIRMEITVVDKIYTNKWVTKLINGRIKNPRWNYKAWRIIHHLKRLPWIGNKIRGKLVSTHVTKDIQ